MESNQSSLFEPQLSERGITDQDAMIWAHNLIEDVNKELNESEKVAELVRAIHGWINLTSFYNTQQLTLYKRGVTNISGTIFEDLATSLLAMGSMIKSVVHSRDRSTKETLESLDIGYDKVLQVYNNIKASYEEWHTGVSESDKSDILNAVKL